jgi:salicylate hydroxylase
MIPIKVAALLDHQLALYGWKRKIVLERGVGAKRQDVSRRLKAYERLRLERTSQIRTMARYAGRFFRAEYEDVAERDRLMAKLMAAIRWTQGHDAEKTAQEALLLAGNDEAIG